MKQSKDEHAKLLQEIADAYKEVGAAEVRAEYAAEIQKLVGGLLAITNRLAALGGVDCTVEVQRNAFAKEKPQAKKRKAVEASETIIEDIRGCYYAAQDKVLTVRNIRQIIPTLGPKYIAAACRSLVESHVLEKVGTKGYRLAQQRENGLDAKVG